MAGHQEVVECGIPVIFPNTFPEFQQGRSALVVEKSFADISALEGRLRKPRDVSLDVLE